MRILREEPFKDTNLIGVVSLKPFFHYPKLDVEKNFLLPISRHPLVKTRWRHC